MQSLKYILNQCVLRVSKTGYFVLSEELPNLFTLSIPLCMFSLTYEEGHIYLHSNIIFTTKLI